MGVVGLGVAVGKNVGTGVGVAVGKNVGTGVAVGKNVGTGVGVGTTVGEGLGDGVGVSEEIAMLGVLTMSQSETTAITPNTISTRATMPIMIAFLPPSAPPSRSNKI